MERINVEDLSSGQNFQQVFLVKDRQLRETRTGSLYLHVVLMDKTGDVPSRMWNAPADILEKFENHSFVMVKGHAEVYKDNMQVIVDRIETVDSKDFDIGDFLPCTPMDVPELFDNLIKAIEDLKDPYLKELLAKIFSDEEIADKFRRAPAAVSYHQPYIGGLIEHTLSILKAAYLLLQHYSNLDRDMVVAGVILHDIGKINELEYDRVIKYSDYGELVGHIVDSVIIVERFAQDIPQFPRELLNRLVHMLISHHGEREWGSPVLPKTPEAIFLHYLDNLDAKIEASTRAIADHNDPSSNWTEYNRMFERRFYKGVGKPDSADE